MNTNQDVQTAVYVNEDHCISWRKRKMRAQLQRWLLEHGVTAQVLLHVGHEKARPSDYLTLTSNYAPIYDDADGV